MSALRLCWCVLVVPAGAARFRRPLPPDRGKRCHSRVAFPLVSVRYSPYHSSLARSPFAVRTAQHAAMPTVCLALAALLLCAARSRAAMQSASPDEPSHDELLAFQTKMEAALDVATRGCEPWCRRPCSQLNGGSEAILAECGGCKGSLYACAPGHSGWPGHPSWPEHPPLPCERRDPPERDVLAAYHSSHAAVIERYYDRYTICYTDTHGKLIQGYRHSSSDADEVRLISRICKLASRTA